MSEFLQKILKWLRDVLPSVTAVGSLIYNYMLRKINALQKQKADLELKLEYEENKDVVEESNRGKSDADIIRDAAREGGGSSGAGPSEPED